MKSEVKEWRLWNGRACFEGRTLHCNSTPAAGASTSGYFSPMSVQFKGEINDALPRKRHQKRHLDFCTAHLLSRMSGVRFPPGAPFFNNANSIFGFCGSGWGAGTGLICPFGWTDTKSPTRRREFWLHEALVNGNFWSERFRFLRGTRAGMAAQNTHPGRLATTLVTGLYDTLVS
jgi:hypothetical protein